ncbi:MAG: porin [Holophaga sp.]|nr:porin [Holophaga sp.]
MKRTPLLLLLCTGIPMLAQSPNLTVTSASGQSNVQIYGLLDMGVGQVAHSATFSDTYGTTTDPRPNKLATKSVTGMFNGGISADRFGFRGSTVVANDWKALFQLEMGINIISGQVSNGAVSVAQNVKNAAVGSFGEYNSDSSVSGQLFGRSAFFGIGSATYGTFTFGRNTSFMADLIPAYDALQGAQMFTPIGYSGAFGGGGTTDNARADQSIKYTVKISDFNLGYLHKFGGVSGNSGARAIDEAMASYESGPFAVSLSYQNCKDATSLAAYSSYPSGSPVLSSPGDGGGTYTFNLANASQVAVTFQDTTATMLTARYKTGPLAIKGGYQHQEIKDPSNPASDMTITSIYGQTVGQVITNAFFVNGAAATKKLDTYWIGAAYDVTAELNVAVGYYYQKQHDYSNGAVTPGKYGSGDGKFTSVLVDYRLTKAFDLYAGYMNTQYDDAMAPSAPAYSATAVNPKTTGFFDSNHVFGAGARYAF